MLALKLGFKLERKIFAAEFKTLCTAVRYETFSISENNESLLSNCRAKNFRANECRAKLV